METFAEMIKLGDLPLEQKEQISDAIIYSAEHIGEFYNEVNHVKLDANKTSMTFMRSYLPKIDKTSDRYKNGLVEGVTPDPETINEAEFTVSVNENGWWYPFTNKALNHAWTDIKTRCAKFLANLFRTYHDEKIADTYLTSANVATNVDLLNLKDLLTLNTILFKSGAQTFEGGFYKLIVAPEIKDAMLLKFKDLITHTTKKEAVVNGELGELAGFRIIASRLQAFEGKSSGSDYKYPFVAYGTNQKGEYAVSICAYDSMAEHVIFTPLGGLGNNDALHQRGSIGLYVDGHGFYVSDDSVAVRGEYTSTGTDKVSPIVAFDDSNRSNLSATGEAGSGLFLNATNIGLTKNGTWTLKVMDENGEIIKNSSVTSSNAAIATVTAVKGTSDDAANNVAFTIKGIKSGVAVISVKKTASDTKVTTATVIVA